MRRNQSNLHSQTTNNPDTSLPLHRSHQTTAASSQYVASTAPTVDENISTDTKNEGTNVTNENGM